MAGRRVQKIVSVSAGFASARFNLHMASQPFDGEGEARLRRAESPPLRTWHPAVNRGTARAPRRRSPRGSRGATRTLTRASSACRTRLDTS